MPEGPSVIRTVVIDASPDVVWDALTHPDELSRWFGGEARLAVRAGGTGRFVTDDGEVRLAVVEEVEPARRLVFSWWPLRRPGDGTPGPHDRSRVTIAIQPDGDETLVTVEEHAIPAARSGPVHAPGLRLQVRPSGPRRGPHASVTRPAVGART
jgi:uncharacterized protein YndB with AHSA1/START domain